MQNCLIADSFNAAATVHSRQLVVDCRQSHIPPSAQPELVKGAKAETETWPMTRRRHNKNNNNLVTVHYSIRAISEGTTKTAAAAAAEARLKTHYSLSFSLNSPRWDSRQFASLLFRFVSLCFVHLILKCLQFSVWNSRRVKGQQCLRSCPLQLINTHSHTHYNNNSNNNFKYACSSVCIIRSNSIQRRRRMNRKRRVERGERCQLSAKLSLSALASSVSHSLCNTKRGTHLSIFRRESRDRERERARTRTKDARGIAGLAPLSVAQLHFILRFAPTAHDLKLCLLLSFAFAVVIVVFVLCYSFDSVRLLFLLFHLRLPLLFCIFVICLLLF